MADPDYGLTIKCTDDLDSLLSAVQGKEAMSYAMLRRIYTPEGSLMSDPTATTLDAREFIGKAVSESEISIMRSRLYQCWVEDERVWDVSVSVVFDNTLEKLTIKADGTGAYGPFSLTIGVTSLTVELLQST